MPAFLFGAADHYVALQTEVGVDAGGLKMGHERNNKITWASGDGAEPSVSLRRTIEGLHPSSISLLHVTPQQMCFACHSRPLGEGTERCCSVGRGDRYVYLIKGWLLGVCHYLLKRIFMSFPSRDNSLKGDVCQPWNKDWKWATIVPPAFPVKPLPKLLRQTPNVRSNNLFP